MAMPRLPSDVSHISETQTDTPSETQFYGSPKIVTSASALSQQAMLALKAKTASTSSSNDDKSGESMDHQDSKEVPAFKSSHTVDKSRKKTMLDLLRRHIVKRKRDDDDSSDDNDDVPVQEKKAKREEERMSSDDEDVHEELSLIHI